jgi:hypothetical protein
MVVIAPLFASLIEYPGASKAALAHAITFTAFFLLQISKLLGLAFMVISTWPRQNSRSMLCHVFILSNL